jgi:hypothetical protein
VSGSAVAGGSGVAINAESKIPDGYGQDCERRPLATSFCA